MVILASTQSVVTVSFRNSDELKTFQLGLPIFRGKRRDFLGSIENLVCDFGTPFSLALYL